MTTAHTRTYTLRATRSTVTLPLRVSYRTDRARTLTRVFRFRLPTRYEEVR